MLGFKKFKADMRGNTAIMAALAIVPILLATGAGIDMMRANNAQTVLQAAADAAAIAGATSKLTSVAQIKVVVDDYLKANGAMDVLDSVDKIESKLDKAKRTFEVKIRGKLKTSLMSIAGISNMELGAYSEIVMGGNALEVALVLDNTGSMNSQGRLSSLKVAATDMISKLMKMKSDGADVKIGIVPFGNYVNVGIANRVEPWLAVPANSISWNGCVGSRSAPLDESISSPSTPYPGLLNTSCPSAISGLTANEVQLKSQIAAMIAVGATYIPQGLLWGWNVLDSSKPFTGGRTNGAMQAAGGSKALVLMTDGANTRSTNGMYHWGSDVSAANTKTASLCRNIKSDEIKIYTVSLMVDDITAKNLLIRCASDPSMAYSVNNAAELAKAFDDIGDSLMALRVSK